MKDLRFATKMSVLLGVVLLAAAPAAGEQTLAHYDFEDERFDPEANTWTVTDKSSASGADAVVAADQLRIVAWNDSHAAHMPAGAPVELVHPRFDRGYEAGLKLEMTLQFETLRDKGNAAVMRKWNSTDQERSFMLFYRAPHLRFSISGDGKSADTVKSNRIETGTVYQLTVVFDPEQDELSMTLVDADGKEMRWTEQTDIDRLYVSNHPIQLGAGFDGYLDDVRISTLEDDD